MARLPRVVVPGLPLHVIQRGNNRQAIYFADHDYQHFYDDLLSASEQFGCSVHAYVYMTNHVHLLVTPESAQGLSRMMQSTGRRYVRYINDTYRRSGTLWEGRFKSAVIDTERYLFVCSRYIELNPVRAGMVTRPQDYPWSSFHFNAFGKADALVTPHILYQQLSADDVQRREAYQSMFKDRLLGSDLQAIRKGTEQCTIVGNDKFQAEIEAILARPVVRFGHGGDRRSEKFTSRRRHGYSSTLTP